MITRVTPHLPKLVEVSARQCYNSFKFVKEDSHGLVKRIMNAPTPHLSVGHHGNILLCIPAPEKLSAKELKQYPLQLSRLIQKFSEHSKGYLNITTDTSFDSGSEWDAVISGNIVAWMGALRGTLDYIRNGETNDVFIDLFQSIEEKLNATPETLYFLKKDEGYANVENPYNYDPNYIIDNKLLVHDDFSLLLSPEECKIHETATVVMRTSRDMSMQFNRHAGGISQFSQRYVLPFDLEGKKFKDFVSELTQDEYDAIKFAYHVPEGIDPDEFIPIVITDEETGKIIDLDTNESLFSNMSYRSMMRLIKTFYFSIFMNQYRKGTNYKRANEQARSMLTNNMSTLIVYTRNRWEWEHFIKLRVDSHTQVEARREAIPLLQTFQKIGWMKEYEIDSEKFVAKKS